MAIDEFGINEQAVNGPSTLDTNTYEVDGFESSAAGQLRLRPGFRIGAGLTETFSPVGLFFWTSETPCEFEEIHTGNPTTDFNSVRDDGDNNRELEKRLRCLTGVEVVHHCLDEDI